MRLIDADAIEHCLVIGGRRHGKTIISEIIRRAIQTAPTVDAVPARHGRWLNKRYGVAFDGKRFPFRTIGTCSECHETSCDAGDYCPWCGAKMDAERKEG